MLRRYREDSMNDDRKLDDNDTNTKPAGQDQPPEPEVNDVPLVGKTEEIDPATVDSLIEDRFEATDS